MRARRRVPQFTTIAGEIRHETDKVKGSRFIATARAVTAVAEVDPFVTRIRREFHDARHVCWAYRIGRDGEIRRHHDDGEPAGSAGRPILQQIEARDLTNVCVCVARYFGGTKLGIGGLVRAYGAAAGAALERAGKRTVVITRRVVVAYPYECSRAVHAVLAASGVEPRSADYGQEIRCEVDVPEEAVSAFLEQLRDRTADRARTTVENPEQH